MHVVLAATLLCACHSAPDKTAHAKRQVAIKQMQFQPAELIIHAGDTVEWINEDMVDHDVTDENNKSWHSGELKKGESWQKVVAKTTSYYCSLHVVMKAKLVVK